MASWRGFGGAGGRVRLAIAGNRCCAVRAAPRFDSIWSARGRGGRLAKWVGAIWCALCCVKKDEDDGSGSSEEQSVDRVKAVRVVYVAASTDGTARTLLGSGCHLPTGEALPCPVCVALGFGYC
jgi:hypothetical protein